MSLHTTLKNNKLMAADKLFAAGVRPLHMKLLLSSTALLLTLSNPSFASDLELKPVSDLSASYQLAKVCFLPDCGEDGFSGDINMDINNDSRWCEKKGYTYYTSGECPQYYKKTDTCKKDNHYLKCDAALWCKDNGYNTSTCSLPAFVDTQCPNGQPLYKSCKEDTARACKQVGYTNVCSGSQKLHASNGRCSWNNSYGTCCSPSGCPSHTGLSGPYGDSGSQDGCGYKCYYTCDMNCPSGTSTSNPGGCGGSTRNGCNTKTCYYPYQACCDENCPSGTRDYRWGSGSCGGSSTRNGCNTKTCYYPYETCPPPPCTSYCAVHNSYHCDCCSDGSLSPSSSQCREANKTCSDYGYRSTQAYYWWCAEVHPRPGLTCWDGGNCSRKTCDELGLPSYNITGSCVQYKPDSDSVTCWKC